MAAASRRTQASFETGKKTADPHDLDTEVPTDSERSSLSDLGLATSLSSFSASVASTSSTPDRTTSPRTPESYSSGGFPDRATSFNEHLEPKWLIIDSMGRLQVVQKPQSNVPSPTLTSSSQTDLLSPPPGLPLETAVLPPPPGLPVPVKLATPDPKPSWQDSPPSSETEGDSTNTILWSIDSRKLNSDHKVIVSPSFELELMGRPVPFKVMLTPKEVTNRKGGQSFKRSRGVGSIQLKCESVEDFTEVVSVKFSVGRSLARGPVVHDFSQTGVCSLKSDQENWDFTKAVDRVSQSFDIRVQILPRIA